MNTHDPVLITGATGFIGRWLVPFLLKQGVSVRVLVRHHCDFFPPTVQQHIGDLTNPKDLRGLANDIQVVFHLGGYAHAWKENRDSAERHHQVNFIGTQNILDECRRAGVKKFVFFSSIKAVGDAAHRIDEDWQAPPETPYGKAKRAAEEQVLAMGKAHPMHVSILRLALVYGPLLKGNLYQMLRAIDKGYFLPVPPVNNHRSLVSVNDVCQAAWLAAQKDEANGKIYFVTDKKHYTTADIYALMRKALGRPDAAWHVPLWIFKSLAILGDQAERLIKRRLPFNSEAYDKLFGISHYSASRIQQELGFDAEYSLGDFLPEIVTAYRTGQAC